MGIRYSFDLGTNSIGSAVWRTGPSGHPDFGPNAPVELLWSGVRLFKDGRNPKDQQSLATMRRIPKQARKRRDRFVLRRADLMKALVEAGLMPVEAGDRKALEARDPYELRARALDHALAPFELGRAIFHLNQRRGFKSNRKTDKGDKDKGKIAVASAKLADALRAQNCRTLGEFLWMRHRGEGHDPKRVRDAGRQPTRIRLEGAGAKALYEFYPTRDMLRSEFDAIWRAQEPHHPALLTPERREIIETTLFRQRDLKPPRIGKCTLVPGEERLPRALPSVEARGVYERLAHIRILQGDRPDRPLTPVERDALASVLLYEIKMTYAKLRKALKLGTAARINFEESGETEIKGSLTGALLAKVEGFAPRWRAMNWAEKDAFVAKLLDEPDEAKLIARLVAEDGLDKATAAAMRRDERAARRRICALRPHRQRSHSRSADRGARRAWRSVDLRQGRSRRGPGPNPALAPFGRARRRSVRPPPLLRRSRCNAMCCRDRSTRRTGTTKPPFGAACRTRPSISGSTNCAASSMR